MTHCTSTIVALRLACSAGNATFTTVPSINAMLDARVVAASTQRPEAFEHGAAAGRERIMLASQGSWINAGMMVACHRPGPSSHLYGFKFNIPQKRHQDSN